MRGLDKALLTPNDHLDVSSGHDVFCAVTLSVWVLTLLGLE